MTNMNAQNAATGGVSTHPLLPVSDQENVIDAIKIKPESRIQNLAV